METNTAAVCRRCGGTMKPGIALEQTWRGRPECPGDTIYTMSAGGPGRLVQCIKCEKCGHSVTTANELGHRPETAEEGNDMTMTVEQALEQADRWHMPSPDTWALDTLADEVRRQRDLLSAARWPKAPDDRRAAQADGKHPAPCARFCEANAFEIELRQLRRENERLKAQIMGPNGPHEGPSGASREGPLDAVVGHRG